MNDFSDLFSWTYGDLKVYDTNIIQHVILVKENENNFKHKLSKINPLLFPLCYHLDCSWSCINYKPKVTISNQL